MHDVYYAQADLVGYLGRKCDELPGGHTLWCGLMNLRLLVEGIQLTTQLN